MNKLQMLLPIGMSCLLLLVVAACFQGNKEEPPFNDQPLFIEPCIPLEGSKVDPCSRDPSWQFDTGVSASYSNHVIPELSIEVIF